jgi:hypothetical protein
MAKMKPGPSAAVSRERAKLLAAQAERWRIRNAEANGELVRAADVEREWTGILRLVRARLLAVGQRHPPPTLTFGRRWPSWGVEAAEATCLRPLGKILRRWQ